MYWKAVVFVYVLAMCGIALGQEQPVAGGGAVAVSWVPPGLPALPADGPALCQGNYLSPNKAKPCSMRQRSRFPDRNSWDVYARHVRERIQARRRTFALAAAHAA